jgi:chromosome partitioning protein
LESKMPTKKTSADRPIIVAIANHKGGTGKTTITRELGACCALKGYHVLLVDCDAQANLTKSFLEGVPESRLNLSHVLVSQAKTDNGKPPQKAGVDQVICRTSVNNLDLVPAALALNRFDFEEKHTITRLASQIKKHSERYDLVLLDCPPNFGAMMSAALMSARFVLMPFVPSPMGLDGLETLHRAVSEMRDSDFDISILGAVANLDIPRRQIAQSAKEAVSSRRDIVSHPFSTTVQNLTEISEAPAAYAPVVTYKKNSKGAEQIWALTEEFLGLLKLPAEA